MKINKLSSKQVEVFLSLQDLQIFGNVLYEVRQSLGSELGTRVASSKEIEEFCSLITRLALQANGEIIVDFSKTEVVILNHLLNEVCNGIKMPEFETKIGIPREQARQLLESINKAMNEMQSIKEQEISSQLSKADLIKLKGCRLEAEDYTVVFYLKKLISPKELIGIFITLDINTDFVDFSISSNPNTMLIQDLWNFIIEFEKYLQSLEENSEKTPLNVHTQLFQFLAGETGITSDGEDYIILNFMIGLNYGRLKIITPFIGVQGIVTLKSIRSFISSIREILSELPEPTD